VNQTLQRTTPARLTEQAATKLPRLLLVAVGLVYILAGLFFRDPWKSDDVIGIATMLSMLQEHSGSWLLPAIGDFPYPQDGPLASWIGAVSIILFGPFFELFLSPLDAAITAARLPNILWFLILTFCFWRALFILAQTKGAQPLALPFGGEPNPRDYARMIADAGLLLLVATVGIIWRVHETSAVPLSLALIALLFFGWALMPRHARIATLLLGLSLGASFLNRGLIGFIPLLLSSFVVFAFLQPFVRYRRHFLLSLLIAVVMILLWWLPAWQQDDLWIHNWWQWHLNQFKDFNGYALSSSARDLLWFLWPTWPLAILALWNWRNWWTAPHIGLATVLAFFGSVLVLSMPQAFEPEYIFLALPSAVLAAFALPTLRRGAINALDWFAVMCYSLTAATVWLGWIAQQSGWPPKIARSIHRQTEGFHSEILWFALITALTGTILWFLLVRWRLMRRPPSLWRGTVLSAAGLITTWLLLVTLWMPTLNYARSYRDVAEELSQALKRHNAAGDCVYAAINPGQRASFYVFDQLQFSDQRSCPLWLQDTSPKYSTEERSRGIPTKAELLWQGRRGGDRNEMFRLLRIPQ